MIVDRRKKHGDWFYESYKSNFLTFFLHIVLHKSIKSWFLSKKKMDTVFVNLWPIVPFFFCKVTRTKFNVFLTYFIWTVICTIWENIKKNSKFYEKSVVRDFPLNFKGKGGGFCYEKSVVRDFPLKINELFLIKFHDFWWLCTFRKMTSKHNYAHWDDVKSLFSIIFRNKNPPLT